MANDAFNGTTFTFGGGAQTPLRSCSYDNSAAEIDVTGAGDSLHTYEAGLPNETLTVEVVGGSSVAVADEGAITIAWFDGTSDTTTNSVCTAVSRSGSLDGEILTTLTFRPTAA